MFRATISVFVMSVFARTQRVILRIILAIFGTAVVAMGVLVFVRLIVHFPKAEAASVIYYPNFCLGGWKYPQHASGPSAVTGDFDPDKFNPQNSAFLESSVASQLFCGYFSVKNAKNPPTKATISFNWLFTFPDTVAEKKDHDSYTGTSTDSSIISPATGFTAPTSTLPVVQQPQNPPSNQQVQQPVTQPSTQQNQVQNSASVGDAVSGGNNANDNNRTSDSTQNTSSSPAGSSSESTVPQSTNAGNTSNTGTVDTGSQNQAAQPEQSSAVAPTSTTDSAPAPTPAPSSEPSPATVQTPAPAPEPAPTPAPAPAPAPEPAPASDAPQSFNMRSVGSFVASLIAENAHAEEAVVQSPLNAESFKDFLEISYSFDGIRWTSIGRVSRQNWKNYKVDIPVSSWDEVKRLQIMVSVLPTIEDKPDIYLDSISMRAEYNRTVAELTADGLSAVTNAVDTLIGDGNGASNDFDIIPDAPKGPQPVEIRIRKLLFASVGKSISVMHDVFDNEGRVVGKAESKRVQVNPGNGGASMVVSGSCDKKYAVILTYRNKDDYLKRRSSYVVNRAQECVGGSFTFDLESLSTETRDGAQYLVVGEQGESGTWEVVSDVIPIMIEGTTTVRTIYKQSDR